MSKQLTFNIAIPTDADGFVGRACDALNCKQYFKIYVPDHGDFLYCPYCGTRFSRSSLLTSPQLNYARKVAIEDARVYAINKFQRMLKNALRGSKNVPYKPELQPRKKVIFPRYVERKVDTEFQCAECSIRFQVYGIFGYCPRCSCENLQIYDANWTNIKRKLEAEPDRDRQLRHGYGDIVSTFEVFCSRKAKLLTQEIGNFQVLFEARKFFQRHASVDILAGINGPELLALRRVFQKRHVCIHAGGEITDRYIKMIPEDAKLIGTQVTLSVHELDTAATAMRLALGELVKAIERPG
jgi:Zn finger protein HypA/HybF involved in hydrogenase expression